MATAREIVSFDDTPPPPGQSPWLPGRAPDRLVTVVDPDPAWPQAFAALAGEIRGALGRRALSIEHVGSTAVPGLPAKPVIDVDLTVADSADEPAYVPALQRAGFALVVREPWWSEHRCLTRQTPRCNLHVFSPGCAELERHRIFRDWLRGDPEDRQRYAAAKRDAAAAAGAAGEHAMQYNARKQALIREIYARAFAAAGLLTDP